MGINHAKVSAVADGSDPTKVQGSDWNDDHVITDPAAVRDDLELEALATLAPSAVGDQVLMGTGNWKKWDQFDLTYPITAAQGLLFRYNSNISQTDVDTNGHATKIYDISGNALHSSTNTTNPPKWIPRGFLGRHNALYFNFNMKLMISGVQAIASPFAGSVIFVGKSFVASGNSHIYNWSGNPIGFGSDTPLDFMYNGTLPTAHTYSAQTKVHLPDGSLGQTVVAQHVYNGANSKQRYNGNEINKNPGITASGATNLFTIGSDSSTGVGGATAQTCRMLLVDFAIFNFALDATQRLAIDEYYKAFYGLYYPAA